MNKIHNLKELPNQGQLFGRRRKGPKPLKGRLGGIGDRISSFARERSQDAIDLARQAAQRRISPAISKAEALREQLQRQAAAFRGAKFERPAPRPIEATPDIVVEDPITGGIIDESTIASIQAEAVADYIQQQENLSAITNGGKTFQIFNVDDVNSDIIDATKETVTAGLWSDNLTELKSYFTQSMTATQLPYYANVLQKVEGATGSAIQYAVAYGNRLGSGSSTQESLDDSPSRAIYSQYSQLLLPKDQQIFSDPGSGSTDQIYVINFQRNRAKDKLDPGNFELPLIGIKAGADANATGSVEYDMTVGGGPITLIDDSTIVSASNEESGIVYNLVSGSIARGVFNPTAPHYYGTVYTQHSTIVLNGNTLDNALKFQTNTASNSEGISNGLARIVTS